MPTLGLTSTAPSLTGARSGRVSTRESAIDPRAIPVMISLLEYHVRPENTLLIDIYLLVTTLLSIINFDVVRVRPGDLGHAGLVLSVHISVTVASP